MLNVSVKTVKNRRQKRYIPADASAILIVPLNNNDEVIAPLPAALSV